MTSREQFEAWFNTKKEVMKSCGISLIQIRRAHDAAWSAWKASREAVEVGLPNRKLFGLCEADFVFGYNAALMKCEEAIHEAGIKVKGE